MQGQLIPIAQARPDLIAEWQALAARAVEPNPWFEPHIVVSLATIRDDICLLVARHESRLRACVVLTSASKSWYGIRLPMWLTPHPMGTPLVDVEDGEEGLRCAFDFVSRSFGPRFLMLQEIDAEGHVAGMVTRALSRGWALRRRARMFWRIRKCASSSASTTRIGR